MHADESLHPKAVAKALARFALAAEAEKEQRSRELEDLRFIDLPETQWPEDVRRARAGGVFGATMIAARPCLSLNQLEQPVQQIVNQAKQSRLAVHINPKGQGASQKQAELRQGLYRNIEVESRAELARMWAFERAAKCGRGFYRILKSYTNDGDDDLDLSVSRILNQHSVYLDPSHQMPDGSDAEWALIVSDISWTKYRREYPKSKLAEYEDGELSSLGDAAPDWVTGDGEGRKVRIAEYFRVVDVKDDDDKPTKKRAIKWQIINAVEVLEEEDWEGRYIPIVQVIGKEININGERRYVGIVRPAMDAQRSYNYMRSAEVEAIGLAPKAPWLVMEGQLEGYEREWQQASVQNLPYLSYRAKNLGGTFAPPPARTVAEPAIQALTIASRQAKDDIQSITGRFNEAQGKTSSSTQSGQAIKALQQQSEMGSSGYLENLANLSMTYEAKIILDLMPYVYDRPGRIVKILEGDDDEASSVMIGKPFIQGQDGQPMPAQGDPAATTFDLSKGQYSCTVSIGKSFSTKVEQANSMMGELAQAMPQAVPMFADVWIRNMDIPGGDVIADRFKKMLPPQLQAKEGEVPPQDPQAQAQIQQLQQANQQLQQMADANQAKLMQEQIKAESAERMKGAELKQEVMIAELKNETERMQANLKAQVEQAKLQFAGAKATMEQNSAHAQQIREQQHEAAGHDVDLQHDAVMANRSQQHERETLASKPV